MNTSKLVRLTATSMKTTGVALSLLALDALACFFPMGMVTPSLLKSQPALAQDAEESINVRVYQQASPAVVSIESRDGSGSGVLVNANGLVLTNAHVVRGMQRVRIVLADRRRFEGDVVAYGPSGLDLAAVQIRGQANLPFVRLARPGSVQVGQRVFAIGNPFGRFQGTLTTGIVSRLDEEQGLIQTDAAINPGNSGGPLLNSQAELIGINTAIFAPRGASGNIGIGFAIAADRVQPFLTAVRDGTAPRTPQRPSLPGVRRPPQAIALNSPPIQGQLSRDSNVLPEDNSFFNAYTFDGRAGQRVVIDMQSSQVDSYLILIGPDGTSIAQDDDSGGGNNSRLSLTLPTDGPYTVFANTYSAGETGLYNLRLSTTGSGTTAEKPEPPGQSGQPQQPNRPTPTGLVLQEEGRLSEGEPGVETLAQDNSLYRIHTFQGRAGQRVVITLESDDFDTYLILVSPDDTVLEQNDDVTANNTNSEIRATLPASGTYRVIANAYDNTGRGNYRLTVR